MGWCDESGRHEGWVRPIFIDGELGTGTTCGTGVIMDTKYDNMGRETYRRVRPFSEIDRLQVVCECGWSGEPVVIADLPEGRIDPKYREPADDWDPLFHGAWKAHVRPFDAAYDLEGLADDLRVTERKIAERVDAARRDGATWEQIGRALGVTRQAAQQRYGG